MDAQLRCRRVSVVRRNRKGKETPVLRSVDAAFGAGIVSLVRGANGAGKSTLLHVIGGLLRPSSGEVLWDGRPVSRWSARHRDRWRRKVGIVFQTDVLLEDLTGLENVMAPLIPRGLSVPEIRIRCFRVLEKAGAADLAREPVAMLSGGQRQRVSVARAVAAEPELLLADEPAAHQDDDGAERVRALLTETAGRGATVIVAAPPGDRLFDGRPAIRSYCIEHGRLEASS